MHPRAPPSGQNQERYRSGTQCPGRRTGRDEKKSTTKPAGGTKKIQRWKDASGKDTFARANLECTAKRPPRCAPDANGQNTAVSEMAGATGRAVRLGAKLNCEDGSVPSSKKGARGKLGRHERNKGGGKGIKEERRKGKKGEKLVQELTKLAERQPRARHNKRKDDDGPCFEPPQRLHDGGPATTTALVT